MTINIVGLLGVVVFYFLITGIAALLTYRPQWSINLWNSAGSFFRKKNTTSRAVNRKVQSLGLLVGSFTITAGWVGGGFISGTVEETFASGVFWTQAPFAYSLSLLVGGIMFGIVMRRNNYVTLLDPFQRRYGNMLGGMLLIPAFIGELFWSLSILTSLATTLSVVLDIKATICVAISVVVVVLNTVFGGLPLLAYTDLVQLSIIFVILWIAVPVILTNPAVSNISKNVNKWGGFNEFEARKLWVWFDDTFYMVLGGIPWQTYFQKVLSCDSSQTVFYLSFASTVLCLLLAVPPVLIGAAATATNWTDFTSGKFIFSENGTKTPNSEYLLPTIFVNLLPPAMLFVCLGSVAASAVSSTVSSVLSASTMIIHNLYHKVIRPQATEKELKWLLRVVVAMIGALAIGLSFAITSVYLLWFLSAELVYLILFPRLLAVIYVSFANGYGCVIGTLGALILRLLFGEHSIHLPSLMNFPPIVNNKSFFPFRTFCMIVGFVLDICVSWIAHYLFIIRKIDSKFDVLNMRKTVDFSIYPITHAHQQSCLVESNSPGKED